MIWIMFVFCSDRTQFIYTMDDSLCIYMESKRLYCQSHHCRRFPPTAPAWPLAGEPPYLDGFPVDIWSRNPTTFLVTATDSEFIPSMQ